MRALVLLIGLIVFASVAQAQTDEQRKAIENVAIAMALETRCPLYEFDGSAAIATLKEVHLDGDAILPGGRYHALLTGMFAKMRNATEKFDTLTVCTGSEITYGSLGLGARGLLKRR